MNYIERRAHLELIDILSVARRNNVYGCETTHYVCYKDFLSGQEFYEMLVLIKKELSTKFKVTRIAVASQKCFIFELKLIKVD
jgi:hypothetical protein